MYTARLVAPAALAALSTELGISGPAASADPPRRHRQTYVCAKYACRALRIMTTGLSTTKPFVLPRTVRCASQHVTFCDILHARS